MSTKPPPKKGTLLAIRQDEVTPASIVEKYNKEFAVCMMGSTALILREQDGKISFFRQKELELLHKNRTLLIKTPRGHSETGQFNFWLRHPDRRTYDAVVFAPDQETPEDTYNLWRKWKIEPKEGDWSLLKQHIWENICTEDKVLYRWVMAWLADGIQNPAKKPGTAIVLKGREGIGKGVFVNAYGSLFAPHYVSVSSARGFLGNFNGHLANCLVLFADEAFWAGNKEHDGVLKDLITGDVINIERKGQDIIKMDNLIRLIMASNNEWVVPAGHDARRYCVLDVSEARKQDPAYFAAIIKQIEDGGREAMMHELKHMDISGVDSRNPPKTKALLKQKINSMEGVRRWWFTRLTTGELPYGRQWGELIPTKELLKQYQDEAHIVGERHKADETAFGMALRAICPIIGGSKKSAVKNSMSDDGRAYCYKLPTKEAARKEFEKVFEQPIQWKDFAEESSESDQPSKVPDQPWDAE